MNKKLWYVLEAITLVDSGATDFEILVTHQIPIEYIQKAKDLRTKILMEA